MSFFSYSPLHFFVLTYNGLSFAIELFLFFKAQDFVVVVSVLQTS